MARERWGDGAKAVVDAACETFALEHAESVFELKTLQKPSQWLRDWIKKSENDRNRVIKVQRDDGEPIYLLGGRSFYFLSKGIRNLKGKRTLTEPASTLWTDIDTNNLRHEGDIEFAAGKKPLKLVERILQMSAEAEGLWNLDYFAGSGTTGHAAINLNREDGGRRKFILVEQADYFDTVLLPRLKKVTYTPEWKDGKPKRFATAEEAERSPRIMKVIRLESYEDTLNNLELRRTEAQQSLLDSPQAQGADGFREQYLLRYMLDVETRGSQSLLNVSAFMDPTAYKLKVKRPGSDESREVNVDLLETFNWLIGLKVDHIAAPRTYSAAFRRDDDPDLPADAPRRLLLDGRLKEDPDGPWWFRTVTGTTPDGRRTLVIWRKRPGGEAPEGIERDNLVLDEWFRKQGYSSKDSEFDLIYVNGDNNLENLKAPDDTWKVRLIEEDFFRLMFEMEGV
jgi:adenine-specific DNA-methyltransferase